MTLYGVVDSRLLVTRAALSRGGRFEPLVGRALGRRDPWVMRTDPLCLEANVFAKLLETMFAWVRMWT